MKREFKIGDIVAFTGKDDYEWAGTRNSSKGVIEKIENGLYYVIIKNNENFEETKAHVFEKSWLKKCGKH